jgi:hypothetical protein
MNIAVADDRAANRGPIVSNGPGGHPGGRPSQVLALPSAPGADRARGGAQSAAVVVALLARNSGPATLAHVRQAVIPAS